MKLLKGTKVWGIEKYKLIKSITDVLISLGYCPIYLPCIYYQDTFLNKVGTDNNNLMYNFKDRGGRDICLAPEYTSVVSELYKDTKELKKLFYVQECFRGEKPQLGRLRQFTQIGVEILNGSMDVEDIIHDILFKTRLGYSFINNPIKGLEFYTGDTFEVFLKDSNKAIIGGGEYKNGVGFAIGIDRILDLT